MSLGFMFVRLNSSIQFACRVPSNYFPHSIFLEIIDVYYRLQENGVSFLRIHRLSSLFSYT